MYALFLLIQYIGILLLLGEIFIIFRQKSSRQQQLLTTIVIAVLVNHIGYLLELQATTKELALQAVKVSYIGKPFIILAIALFMLQYYRVKCPKWLLAILTSLHSLFMLLVLVCEHNKLFYTKIDFVEDGYFPHLVLSHGIFYYLFMFLVAVYLTAFLILGARHYRYADGKREKTQIKLLSSLAVLAALGLVAFFSGLTKGYDATLPAYLLASLILLLLVLKYDILDTLTLAKENILDELTDGLVVLDQNHKVIYTNQQARRLYPDLLTERREQALAALDELYQCEEKVLSHDEIYEIHKKDIVRDGISYGNIYRLSNITEAYHYTIKLEEQTLLAKQASQAKSDFLAKMSHEIRTPIHAVLGMNEMILRESKEEEIIAYAIDMKASANVLLSQVNDILDLSKIESGKLELLPVEYELDSLLNDVVNLVFVKVQQKGLELNTQVDDTLPNVLLGDDVRIRQILTNLLNNAVKYTAEGSVTLAVSGRQNGDVLKMHYEVRDTGIGIKEEDMPKLYASFERIDEKRNRGIEGTGLGMSIVLDLLHLMGSTLKVESVYGKGTTFSFDLEQKVLSDTPVGDFEGRSRRMVQAASYQALFQAPDAKILIVDDNDINRNVFRNLLKHTKLQIQEANSGFRCLELVEREHFDLIFLDHMMPELDGIETLHRMKELPGNLCKDTPVIILTANATAGARERYVEEGADDYLPKPIHPEKLEQLIKTLLPEEYLLETVNPEQKAEEPLPEIEGFDWYYAKQFLKDESILRTTLQNVYDSIDGERKALADLMSRMGEEGVIEAYRTRVHALKSTFGTVGGIGLSQLAKLLEEAAIAGNQNRIQALHPVLMEELESCKEHMFALAKPQEERLDFDGERVSEALHRLQTALEELDYDAADEQAAELEKFSYDGELFDCINALIIQISELEIEAAKETAAAAIRLVQVKGAAALGGKGV